LEKRHPARRFTVIIWRGWGLLAVVALFPLLASCSGLINVEPKWIFILATSLALLFAAAVCAHFGVRWNRTSVEHSLYSVPLQVWGWVYLAMAGLVPLGAIGGAIRQGLDKPPWLYQGIAGVAGLGVVLVVGVALRKSARTFAERAETSRDLELNDGPVARAVAEANPAWSMPDIQLTKSGKWWTKYVAAISASSIGMIVSLFGAWRAAIQWNSFSDKVIYGTWILPLLLYFFAFWLVARRTGEWPVERRSVRFINGGILGIQCAALAYLSFVLVSFTWNEHVLPPEKASITHLIFHPSDIPQLKEVRRKVGENPKEWSVSWHKGVFLGFVVGAFCGYVYSMGKGGRL
jgi:hypothetical protein